MPNPASTYVHYLGYKLEIRKSPNGGEYGVCIFPDSSECEEWSFYRGICGQNYSYCALKGCRTENIQEPGRSYCVCSCLDSIGNKVVTRLDEFMEQHGDTLIKLHKGIDD